MEQNTRFYELYKEKYRILSLVGMAKNAGKTVLLNHLISELAEAHQTVGLTSIGRDGERTDIVTQTEKPGIYVPAGTIIATAEALFYLSEAQMELLEVTEYATAMGKVVIGKCRRGGFVQLGGPVSNRSIREVAEKMRAFGAHYVLIDGALDRCASASPAVADACFLSTGAAISRRMDIAVEETAHRAMLFSLPAAENDAVSAHFENSGEIALIDRNASGDGYQIRPLPVLKTGLGAAGPLLSEIRKNTAYILFPGALVYSVAYEIMEGLGGLLKPPAFVVRDATKVFISPREWRTLKRFQFELNVYESIRLLAVSANPVAPKGYRYDAAAFMAALKQAPALSDIPIIDVLAEVKTCP
ncbi:MAG: hypothetical protein PWQ12_1414 [Clostridiales bacterium]|nr:hypothetical protein [Clostridiales bacterium]